jgi:hypothetical protein
LRRTILLALVSSLLGFGAAFPSRASGNTSSCASTVIYLGGYEGTAFSPYYSTTEGDPVNFEIHRQGHICTTTPASATYSLPEAIAVYPEDYAYDSETVDLATPVHLGEPTRAAGSTTTAEDVEVESLEHFTIRIDSVEGAGMGVPRQAPALVIDDDGGDRFSFGPGSVVGSESSPSISFPVVRLGPAATEATVELLVGAPTDSATRPGDYTGTESGTLTFAPGDANRVKTVSLTVVNDALAEQEETITIGLSGATIEGPATRSVTIQDNEEQIAPVSRWHHPKNGVDYAFGDLRLREIHVYADDNLSRVAMVHFALRRKLSSGACRWWNGTGFASGSCTQKKWIKMRTSLADPVGNAAGDSDDGFYIYRLPKLASSVRTTIRNYTAYSRATDKAGNVETLFQVGRNLSTFEVKRP